MPSHYLIFRRTIRDEGPLEQLVCTADSASKRSTEDRVCRESCVLGEADRIVIQSDQIFLFEGSGVNLGEESGRRRWSSQLHPHRIHGIAKPKARPAGSHWLRWRQFVLERKVRRGEGSGRHAWMDWRRTSSRRDVVRMPTRWPDTYSRRFLLAAGFFLPPLLIGFLLAELIVQWPVDAALVWLGVFGPAALIAAAMSAAALNRPGTPIRFLQSTRHH